MNWFCLSPWALWALYSCSWESSSEMCTLFFLSHAEVKPTLTSTSHFPLFLAPSTQHLSVFPHVLPQGLQPPGAASHNPPPPPPPPPAKQQQHHRINMHLPDKWSTLSVFSRQIRSHPLAVSQPFWLICLSPHIAASQPDAFSFRQITGST